MTEALFFSQGKQGFSLNLETQDLQEDYNQDQRKPLCLFHLQKLICIPYFPLENQHIYTLPNKVVFSDGLFYTLLSSVR